MDESGQTVPAQSTNPGEPGFAHPMLLRPVPEAQEVARLLAQPKEVASAPASRTITVNGSVQCLHGMTDLVAALRWVRDNIANFGGDPDCVMIYGQSGGGSKVTTLLGMPQF